MDLYFSPLQYIISKTSTTRQVCLCPTHRDTGEFHVSVPLKAGRWNTLRWNLGNSRGGACDPEPPSPSHRAQPCTPPENPVALGKAVHTTLASWPQWWLGPPGTVAVGPADPTTLVVAEEPTTQESVNVVEVRSIPVPPAAMPVTLQQQGTRDTEGTGSSRRAQAAPPTELGRWKVLTLKCNWRQLRQRSHSLVLASASWKVEERPQITKLFNC